MKLHRRRAFFIIITFLAVPMVSLASEPKVVSSNFRSAVSIHPFYRFVDGIRVDYQHAITRNNWIMAGTVLFYSQKTNPREVDFGYNKRLGGGLHLHHKFYPAEGFGITRVYISYGPVWQYNHLTFPEKVAGTNTNRFTIINRFGADILIGYDAFIGNQFFLEFFTGFGLRYSGFHSDATEPDLFNSGYVSPGYTGNLLLLGLKFGFAFNP